MKAEAINKISELAVDADGARFHEEHGINHLLHKGALTPILQPLGQPLAVRTLAAVIDYLTENRDDLDLKSLSVVVDGPGRVSVVGKARHDGRRAVHIVATEPDVATTFPSFLNRYMSTEDFVVGLQQRFRAGGHIVEVLGVVGNITQGDVRATDDDGTSQEATVKIGIVKVGAAKVPNPVQLCPRRSFPEVNLDYVPFVLRLRKGETLPQVALFEADGGAWAADATAKIAEWLDSAWRTSNPLKEVGDVGEAPPFGVLA